MRHFKFSRPLGRMMGFAAMWLAVPSLLAGLRILPEEASLHGRASIQQMLLVQEEQGGSVADLQKAAWSSSDSSVATVDSNGLVTPRADGKVILTASMDGRTASASVTVTGMGQLVKWSFRNHVLPVLAKQGCNMGACHGALAGKGGFRLSLRGYDPVTDHYNITRDARGRRVELAAPARSLLLTKPTMAVAHKGGKRLEAGSRDYHILAGWIQQGAPAPDDSEAELISLEVQPRRMVIQPGDAHRLVVTANYSDGTSSDVTSHAKFSSTDATVAEVDEVTGEVKVIGYGEGAINVWYSSRVVIARVTSPFPNAIPETVFRESNRANFIDDLVLAQLKRLNLKPSPRSSDEEFVRRAYLDAIGTLPTAVETQAFLEDAAPDKRVRLIDRLLSRAEFVDYWTYRWGDLFLINGKLLRPDAVKSYYEWLRQQVAANASWDSIARQVVTAKGDSMKDGAVNFYSVHQDPETMAENVSQAFLGLSINCAKCHNHPLEKWTNDQYYSFANLFARVRAKGWGGDARNGNGVRTLYVEPRGDLIQPRTGKPQPPAPLDAEPIASDSEKDRREYLADWLTLPENEGFSRSIVNRVWAAFFGIGIVNPVDDLRVSNPPSNEPLMEELSRFLVANRYDLKILMRTIMMSETYQRSSGVLPENRDENRHFSRYYPRRLMAEVLHDAIVGVTDLPADFNKVVLTDGSSQDTKFYPKGTRALQLFDSSVKSYFLETFGRNERAITCECERSNIPSMVQVLHLANGDTLNKRLRDPDCSLVASLLDQKVEASEIIDECYLRCLSRKPTDRESKGLQKVFQDAPKGERREVIEDLLWALMTSREFLFQH